MTDYAKKLLPRFRYGVIHPRAHEDVQRGPCYQLYRLLPLDFMEISTGLGLENHTEEGVEKAIKNYWTCIPPVQGWGRLLASVVSQKFAT